MIERRGEGLTAPEATTEPEERIELEDPGETIEKALAEAEQSVITAAEEKVLSLQKDLAELNDRHLRKLAEFENMKRRSAREREEYARAALMRFARDFLPILDHVELAMQHATPEERQSDFGQGIGLIRRQLVDQWKGYGLQEVDTSGPFDPNLHEAVATEAAQDVPPQTILGVLQKGYMLDDKLVRPALVKVAVHERDTPSHGIRRNGAEEED
jgi:molecular chaperone GrpE